VEKPRQDEPTGASETLYLLSRMWIRLECGVLCVREKERERVCVWGGGARHVIYTEQGNLQKRARKMQTLK
jgi:hypothetical protein